MLPHILLLMTDQQRFDTIASLASAQDSDIGRIIKTPALDRLCTEGTSFVRCYTPSPVCVPARQALACGQPPHITGLTDNGNARSFCQPRSLMQMLAARGYQTHGVGKMHFVPDSHTMWGYETRDYSEENASPKDDDFVHYLHANGYDYVDDPHGVRSEYYYIPQPSQLPDRLHHTRWVADKSIEFLERRDKKRPFFMWSSWIKPHPPFELPTPWNKLYRASEMAEPLRFEGDDALWTYWNYVQNRYKWRGAGYDAALMRTIRAAYCGCISYIDSQIARILAALGEEIDNTLILFTADHGELLGDYGCVGKRCMLDVAARVPMIARLPGRFAAGARCETPVSLLDIFPTVAAAAEDQTQTPSREGRDLAEIAGQKPERIVFSQFQERGFAIYMATDGRSKYVYSEADQKGWLYDLVNDPHETRPNFNPPAGHPLKEALLARFRQDHYLAPLNDAQNDWRSYPCWKIPDDPDAGLLFQDANILQQRINTLGPYARAATVPGKISYQLLSAPPGQPAKSLPTKP